MTSPDHDVRHTFRMCEGQSWEKHHRQNLFPGMTRVCFPFESNLFPGSLHQANENGAPVCGAHTLSQLPQTPVSLLCFWEGCARRPVTWPVKGYFSCLDEIPQNLDKFASTRRPWMRSAVTFSPQGAFTCQRPAPGKGTSSTSGCCHGFGARRQNWRSGAPAVSRCILCSCCFKKQWNLWGQRRSLQ